MVVIKCVRKHPDAKVPSRSYECSAGYDLYSVENTVIMKRSRGAVDTGVVIEIPDYYYGRVASRSGLAFHHGIEVGAGVIDQGFTGCIKVLLHNHGDKDFHIKSGDRIAQIIFEYIGHSFMQEVEEIGSSERGERGFGSSGC